MEFDVSRTGVPVMVKTSWYPNWEAEGAEGPWRATPNFMVVVPTAKHVKLTFTTATVDWVGRALTVVGLVGLGGLVWWGMAARRPDESTTDGPVHGADGAVETWRRRYGFEASAGTIPVPLPAVRTRGSSARLCARLHLQGL